MEVRVFFWAPSVFAGVMDFGVISLCVVQGIGEILPISSSVNLYLFSKLFHISDFSFSLKTALHLGSLLTLLIYFRREIANIFKGLFSKKTKLSETYFLRLLLGTIPVVILGYFSKDFAKEFDSSKIMGVASVFFGLSLLFFDNLSRAKNKAERNNVPVWKAFVIGCFQTLALLPGVSRLGICVTASRMLGLDRRESIRFSLLLAIPSILGSLVILELSGWRNLDNLDLFSTESAISLAISAVSGLFIICPAIRFMEKKGFLAIAVYRIAIGTILCFL